MQHIKHLNHLVPLDFTCDEPIIIESENKSITIQKDYLCDLFNSILKKYLNYSDDRYGKDVEIQLSSKKLKKKYGNNYTYYVKHLVDIGYIRLIRKGMKGSHCNTYKFLYWKVEQNNLVLHKNENRKMIDNYEANKEEDKESSKYGKRLVNSIRKNLNSITIDKEKAIGYLDNKYAPNSVRKYVKNYKSILDIHDGNIYLKPDDHGRLHSNFTILKKEIRNQFLNIDGEPIKEKDISNSQALFFLYLLSQNINEKVEKSELLRFESDVIDGVLYDKLAAYAGMTRKEIKPRFFKYLFGGAHTKFTAFNACYPTILKFVRAYKKQLGNYKLLSHQLQMLEGDFIFNGICSELSKRKIKYFTVHDSICVKATDYEVLDSIFEEKLDCLKQKISENIRCYHSHRDNYYGRGKSRPFS